MHDEAAVLPQLANLAPDVSRRSWVGVHIRNACDNAKDRSSHLRHQLFYAREPTGAADPDNLTPRYRRVQRNRLAPLVQDVAAYQRCSQAFLHDILDMVCTVQLGRWC
jgi:hypothetical protein